MVMLSTQSKTNNTLIAKRNYTFDAVGRVATRTQTRGTDTARNDSFGYNDRSELTSATLGNDNYAYSFDNIGNRITAEELADEIAYSANNLNQYTAIEKNSGTPFVPTFDDDGNQLTVQTATGVWNVTYNAENRPITFTQGTTVIECKYDSQGRRFEKKVTANGTVIFWQRYTYKGYLQIAAFDVSIVDEAEVLSLATTTYWDPTEPTATRPLAFTDHTVATPATYFYTHDLTKNICEILSRDGSAVSIATTYDYTPFGAVSTSNSATPNTFTFSSEVLDQETGLVYYNYRHYNPTDGRWTSRDQVGELESFMLYLFLSNASLMRLDRLGLEIDDSGFGEKNCETYFLSKSIGPINEAVAGKADFALAVSFWGSGSKCCTICRNGKKGNIYKLTFSVNAGIEIGLSTYRFKEGFRLFNNRLSGEYDGWLGLRAYGGIAGVGEVLLSANTCDMSFDADGDIFMTGYAGLEVGGQITAKGNLDLGWFGSYKFDAGVAVKGTGRLTSKWNPKLRCNNKTCSLSGPYSMQVSAFVDVSLAFKGYSFGKRFSLGESDEYEITPSLGFSFPNPFELS